MNIKIKILLTFGALAGLWLAAPGTLQAQLEKVSISGTLYEQGAQSDNDKTTTTKAPAKVSLSTATVLKQLAKDEFAEGNYTSSLFPSAAKLVYNGLGFEVDDGTNELV